jgi:hypothetical protein
MRVAKKPVVAGRKHSISNERVETFSLSRAKAHLEGLVEKASRGEIVYIIHGRHRFVLQPVREIEPIPVRPIGYFGLDEEDIALDQQLASAGVIPNPNRG